MTEKINEFMFKDNSKLEEIIEKYPKQIPVDVIAEWWGCTPDSIRTMLIEDNIIGVGWRKAGKLNRGFCIPTGHFLRWYLCMNFRT